MICIKAQNFFKDMSVEALNENHFVKYIEALESRNFMEEFCKLIHPIKEINPNLANRMLKVAITEKFSLFEKAARTEPNIAMSIKPWANLQNETVKLIQEQSMQKTIKPKSNNTKKIKQKQTIQKRSSKHNKYTTDQTKTMSTKTI